MRLDLKVPCKNCPFANRDTRITFACRERAEEIAESAYRNGFPCHLSAVDTSDEDEEHGGFVFKNDGTTQHCAGAIGMFLNDSNYTWPGIDNRDIDERKWLKAMNVAFESEEAFLDANTTGREEE